MRRDGPLRVACALVALALPLAATAAAPVPAGVASAGVAAVPEASPSAPLDLFVNGAPRGVVDVVLRGGDALVPLTQLKAAGLRGLEGRGEECALGVCVSLGSLAPALRFELDEVALALRITARAELLGRAAVDLSPSPRPPGLAPRGDPTAFLNYAVRHTARTGVAPQTAGSAEAGASQDGRLVYSSGELLEDGTAVRGLSNLTVDDVGGLRRFVAGDLFATGTPLGGGVLLGGLSVRRELSIDPYLLHAPMPQLTGFAASPSTLDVYVNGVLTRQVPVQPGGFDLTNLPVAAGAGTVHTVLRDAFGRTETLDLPYYYSAGLLAPGLSDYGYSLGFRRRNLGRRSFDYGSPVFVGRHRLGVTESATLGGRLDLAADLASGGPSATFGLPFGTLDLEAAGSAEAGRLGAAASAGYGFLAGRFTGSARVRILARRYAHAALRQEADRPLLQSTISGGVQPIRGVQVEATWSLLELRDSGRTDVLSLRTGVALARGLALSVTGTRTWAPASPPTHAVFGLLSWAFAPMSLADVSVEARERAGTTALAGVQRGLPAGTGVGYRARGGSGRQGQQAHGLLQAQWDHGTADGQYDRFGDQEVGSVSVAGGVVVLGERVLFTRPVQQGYALLRVGVPGVRGYAEGQEIGRTDGRGDLFVPQLAPYLGNRVAIADQDIPMEYRFGKTELLAAPMLRGAIVARFDVTPARAVEGTLHVVGADRAPAYGELRLTTAEGVARSSPVAEDGRFFVEDVSPGTHLAEIEWTGGLCRAALAVPAAPPIVDVGRVPCHPTAPPAVPAPVAPPAPGPEPMAASTTAPASAPDPEPVAASTTAPTPAAAPEPAAISTIAPSLEPTSASTTAPRNGTEKRYRNGKPIGPKGYGPRSWRCPSCAVCLDARLHRVYTASALLRCVNDLAVIDRMLSRAAAANVCLAKQSLDEICEECLKVRALHSCPRWPSAR